jgi:hypothetical protein
MSNDLLGVLSDLSNTIEKYANEYWKYWIYLAGGLIAFAIYVWLS